MSERPKISVIVPVYNAEPYLSECVESLLNQTLKECEFIFVNDGSEDTSLLTLQKYQKHDPRIKIITQKNAGIARARNKGLDAAIGSYIGFCDNDDYVKVDMYETLYNAAIRYDVDIVVSNTVFGRDGKEIIKGNSFSPNVRYDSGFVKSEMIPNLLEKEDLFAVWNKLYSADLVQKKSIRFPANRQIEEDNMFNLAAFNQCHSVVCLNYSGYYFRERQISESRRLFDKDYFKLALEKFHFDYKSHFQLEVSDEQMERNKATRFIHRVFFLTFTYAIAKDVPFEKRFAHISEMVFHPQVKTISIRYSDDILKNSGLFEKLLYNSIKYPSKSKLFFLIKTLSLIYSPKLSEVLRYINGKG